jgi:tRNA-modifying protein YgfZ
MIAHLEDRRVLRVSGEDVRGFLNGLLTSDLTLLSAERPLWAALLTAQGKVIADMIVFDGHEAGVYLDVHKDRAEDIAKRLKLYRLRRKIDIEPAELNVFAAGLPDWHAHRIALGIPDSPDIEPEKLLWLEANAAELNGVSFDKGCYVGQENTARMNWRGKVRKRLLPVTMVAGPAADRTVLADGKPVGTLTSQAEMHGGEWRGIAHMRVEDAHRPLHIDGAAAEVDWPDWLPREAEVVEA